MNRTAQRLESEIVDHWRRWQFGSRSGNEEDMRPNAEVVVMRMITRRVVIHGRFGRRLHRMGVGVITGFRFVIIDMIVRDRTNWCVCRIAMVANVCPRSGAAAHQVLRRERNEHHQ